MESMMAAEKRNMRANKNHIRPFDVRSDLLAVSDLVEVCFADRLSRDGEALLRKMRASAGNQRFQQWAHHVAGRVSMPFTGFVWVEDGQVVGNLSLIPYHMEKRHFYMIANVAVHPHYQRRGIGRALVRRALRFLAPRQVDGIWLQVDEENKAAIRLYLQEGFLEQARRTTWYLDPDDLVPGNGNKADPACQVHSRRPGHWARQRRWLGRIYPAQVRWHLPLKLSTLRGGILGMLTRVFQAKPDIQQWSVTNREDLVGVISWQSSKRHSDWLWLAASPGREGLVLDAFFSNRGDRDPFPRRVRLDYPADQAGGPLRRVGFRPSRTLIWMRHDGHR